MATRASAKQIAEAAVERPASLDDIDLRLEANERTDDGRLLPRLSLDMVPAPPNSRTDGERPLWHVVKQRPHLRVFLASHDTHVRVIKLNVRGLTPGWNPKWVRFSYAVRRHAPGPAHSAQDRLSADEAELTLLLLPPAMREGEPAYDQREALIEIAATLDEENRPGDYDFEVIATDVTVRGDATASGASRSVTGQLRLLHPSSALLGRLPAIYAEELSRDRAEGILREPPFFERFLLGFEDVSGPMGESLGRLSQYFGAFSTPRDFVPWLATWVGLVLDENWTEMKRRRLLREAVRLYAWRGTRRGLARYLEIYADATPEISDRPVLGMRLGAEAKLNTAGARLGDVGRHTFVVRLAVDDPDSVKEHVVRQIIESQKPAHAQYHLHLMRR